jgi:hypothetical protein
MIKTQLKPLNNDQIVKLAPAAGASNPHEAVSSRYSFVPTLEAVDLVRKVGWVPFQAKQSAVRKEDRQGYQKHIIRFQMEGLRFSDQERVDLVMFNSHDRGCAFHLMASIWRKVCGNGLMVAADLFNFSHKHIGFDAEAFAYSAQQIASSAGEIAAQVEDLKAIELQPNEKGIYATAAHQLLYDDPQEAPIMAERLLDERRYDDEGNDLWTVFNVVQENIMKGGLRGRKRGANGRMRNTKTRPVKAIDRDVKLNKALWIITEQMAQSKKAA